MSEEIQHSKEVRVSPEMIRAGIFAFARELPEVEEAMRNAETADVVSAIYAAMSAKIEWGAGIV
jgi:hypothetical protein